MSIISESLEATQKAFKERSDNTATDDSPRPSIIMQAQMMTQANDKQKINPHVAPISDKPIQSKPERAPRDWFQWAKKSPKMTAGIAISACLVTAIWIIHPHYAYFEQRHVNFHRQSLASSSTVVPSPPATVASPPTAVPSSPTHAASPSTTVPSTPTSVTSSPTAVASKPKPATSVKAVKKIPVIPTSAPDVPFTLNGTMLMGDNGVAIINQHMYHVGDTIKGFKITKIYLDRIKVKDLKTQQIVTLSSKLTS